MSEMELLLRAEAGRLRAPERLRERVLERAGGVREPRFVLPPLRRSLLVAIPVAVAAVAAAAVVHGFLGSETRQAETGPKFAPVATAREHAATTNPRVFGAAQPQVLDRTAAGAATLSPVVPAPTGRLTDYQATLRVRVRDLDKLTDATSDAVRIVRSLGGYAASVNTTTGNGPGQSYLELRVPANHVQDALLRLSGLGTVLSQQLSQRDLQAVLDRQNAQIAAIRRAIHRYEIALATPGLAADTRVRLQIQLDTARRALHGRLHARGGTLKEAATAKISLELTTERNAAAPPTKSRFDRSIDGAVGFLAGAGAISVAVLIAASPFLVLAALALAGRRAWRRREEQRLLAAQ